MDPRSRSGGRQGREVGKLLKGASWAAAAIAALALLTLTGCVGSTAAQSRACTERSSAPSANVPALPFSISAADRILVIAPHPDDETIGAGGLLATAAAAGAKVRVVLVTAGDGYDDAVRTFLQVASPAAKDRLRLGEVRVGEARSALDALGLDADSLVLLGFPDGQIGALWRARETGSDTTVPSAATGVSRVPYAMAVAHGAPYTPDELARWIRLELADFEPTIVVLPHPLDAHPDHAATGEFVLAALAEQALAETPGSAGTPHALAYLVHHGLWPIGDAGADEMPPPLPTWVPGTRWAEFAIDEPTRGVKIEAITRHRSQMTVMGRFLMRFARGSELFGALEPWCHTCPTASSHEATRDTPARFVTSPP